MVIFAVSTIALLLLIVRTRHRPAPAPILNPTPAQLTLARKDLDDLRLALLCFGADNGEIPSAASAARSLVAQPAGMFFWQGPYIRSLPTDPWGRRYIYTVVSSPDGPGVTVFSKGPDGLAETSDDIHPIIGSCGTGEWAMLTVRKGRREVFSMAMTESVRQCVAIPWSLLRGDRDEAEVHWVLAQHFLSRANEAAELRSAPLVRNIASVYPVQP